MDGSVYSWLMNITWLPHLWPKLNIHIVFEPLIKLCSSVTDCTVYHIAGNFRWCKFLRKCAWTLQKKFSQFISRTESVMLWLYPYQMMATPHMHCNRRNDTEQRSEASLCNNDLLFLLCKVLSNYESIKTARRHGLKTGLLNRSFSTADLDFDNFRASLTGSLVPLISEYAYFKNWKEICA